MITQIHLCILQEESDLSHLIDEQIVFAWSPSHWKIFPYETPSFEKKVFLIPWKLAYLLKYQVLLNKIVKILNLTVFKKFLHAQMFTWNVKNLRKTFRGEFQMLCFSQNSRCDTGDVKIIISVTLKSKTLGLVEIHNSAALFASFFDLSPQTSS